MADKTDKLWIFCLPLAIIWLVGIEIIEHTKPIITPFHNIYKSNKTRFQQNHKAAKRAKERMDNAPQPLPASRPHSLSTIHQTPQPASRFLTGLPPEIRQEIYTYVLGGKLIHILRKGKHLAHIRCKREDESDFQRSCRPHAANTCHSEIPTIASTTNGNVALLRTCRQLYAEAVEVLYATNTFDFDHQDLFLLFARAVLPERLEVVRRLQFYCREMDFGLPFFKLDGPSGWELMWTVIGNGMPGLKHLRIRIIGEQGLSYPSGDDRWWVEAMCRIRGLKSFDLEFRAPSNCWVGGGEGVFEKERLLEGFIRGAVCSEVSRMQLP